MSPLLQIEQPQAPAPGGFALWNLGFRPFYLAASLFAALSIALWTAEYAGHFPGGYLQAPFRHGHEMLFGFAFAVIAGFLFTAVRNWANQDTPTGGWLAAIVALWLLARVLMLTPFAFAAAAANAAFPVAVAVGIAIPLARARNRRNYFFVPLLVIAGLAALALHLSALGILDWPVLRALQVGLDVALFIVAVIAGRVMPMFTNNAIAGAGAERRAPVEKVALGSLLALLAADIVGVPAWLLAAIAGVGALAHAVRLALWRPWRTGHTPLVWVLHAAYAWVAVHLALRALAALGLVGPQFATHALTIGVIGGMTIGMMTRTARGHTGRRLEADRFEVACYVLVQAAALVRVFGGMAWMSHYVATVIAAGVLWSLGFALYAVRYWPVLTRPRIDGKPG